ncbi:MAG: hypothetical protein V3V39_10555 [Desulfobacterales bacterium]|jgi:hypothetical protein
MNIIKTDYFGEVESIRLGYGPIGPPLMSVFMYIRNKLQFLEDLYGNVRELTEKGHSEKVVIKALDPKNDRRVKWVTMGNASFANMVRSAMASIRNH